MRLGLAVAASLGLAAAGAQAAPTCPVTQSSPGLTGGGNVFGKIASQWNSYFGAKVDANNGVLCNPTIVGGSGIGLNNFGIAPGLSNQFGARNTGSQVVSPSGTLFPQTWVVTKTTNYTVNADFGGVSDSSGKLLSGATSVTFTLPNPSGATQGISYAFGSDGPTHGLVLTTAGGTATIYGCPSGGGTSATFLPDVDVTVVDDGTNYKCESGGNLLGPSTATITDDFPSWTSTDGVHLHDSGIPRTAVNLFRILMYPNVGQSSDPTVPWIIKPPPGGTVVTTGTHSQGLNEVLKAAVDNGWQPVISGGGLWDTAGNQLAPLFASEPVVFPAAALFHPVFHGVALYINAADGVVVDSCSVCAYDMPELIRFTDTGTTGNAFHLKPANNTTVDPGVHSQLSVFNFGAVVKAAGNVASPVIYMDNSNGAIFGDTFNFTGDICGGCNEGNTIAATDAIVIGQPGANDKGFIANTINAPLVHGISTACVREGTGTGFQSALSANKYNIAYCEPATSAGEGFDGWGWQNQVSITAGPGECGKYASCSAIAYGVRLQAGATGNVSVVNSAGTVTTVYQIPTDQLNSATVNGVPTFSGVELDAISPNFMKTGTCPITPGFGIPRVLLTAGALGTCTLTMPTNPQNTQSFKFSALNAITTLTVNTSDGSSLAGTALTTTAGGVQYEWIYTIGDTTWSRVQ